jgi:hypothetical protein
VNMSATPSSDRKTYDNLQGGRTSIDLSRVCAFTSQPVDTQRPNTNMVVEFHMCSGTIFSCKLGEVEYGKLQSYWRYA